MTIATDYPDYAFDPDRQSAVRAINWRDNQARVPSPIVEIRCAGSCGQKLGGVWVTPFGDLLVVRSRPIDDDKTLIVEANSSQGGTRTSPRMTDDIFIEEQPILLGRGGPRFPVWCGTHGAWRLDERGIAERVREAKMFRRKMTFGASPGD